VDPRKHVLDEGHGRMNPFVTREVTRRRCGLLSKFFDNLLLLLLVYSELYEARLPLAQSMPVCPGLQMQSPVTWSQLLFSLHRQSCRHAKPCLPGGHAVHTNHATTAIGDIITSYALKLLLYSTNGKI